MELYYITHDVNIILSGCNEDEGRENKKKRSKKGGGEEEAPVTY